VVYSAMGDVFGPVVGVIVGDWARRRGASLGSRRAMNPNAVIAWGAGVLAATILDVLRVVNREYEDWCQPTSICGFVASFVAFSVLTRLGSPDRFVPATAVDPARSSE
jgi:cytosine/uracil/thiamine/allantoin permease